LTGDALAAVEALAAHAADQGVRRAAAELLRALGRDRDADYAARLSERDRLLRATGLPPVRLADAIRRYRAAVWPRTRLSPADPHRPGSLHSRLWQALALVDRGVGERQVRRIFSDIGSRSVR
jgi:hypothetical protein